MSLEEENQEAKAIRERNKAKRKLPPHAKEKKMGFEDKLLEGKGFKTKSEEEKEKIFNSVRVCKFRQEGDIKDQYQITISQQQEQQHQQQQQQQIQIQASQKTTKQREKKYEIYKGFKNLINIQKYNNYTTDADALAEVAGVTPGYSQASAIGYSGLHSSYSLHAAKAGFDGMHDLGYGTVSRLGMGLSDGYTGTHSGYYPHATAFTERKTHQSHERWAEDQKICAETLNKLRKLRGNHDSSYGTIGYLTKEAAHYILQNEIHFQSGIFFDNLPDGFCLYETESERHLDPRQGYLKNSVDSRKFPRLVLDYKPQIKNTNKNELTLRIPEKKQEPVRLIGSPGQFNAPASVDNFHLFRRGEIKETKIDHLLQIERKRTWLINQLNKKDKVRTELLVQKFCPAINEMLRYDKFLTFNIFQPKEIKDSDTWKYYQQHDQHLELDSKEWTFEDVERNLQKYSNELQHRAERHRELFCLWMKGEAPDLAERLIDQYRDLFLIFNRRDYAGLLDILMSEGCEGLSIFLKKMQTIYDSDQGTTFFYLKESFLQISRNWNEFIDDDTQITLDKIAELSPANRQLWNNLSSQHLLKCDWANINDLFAAFQYATQKYCEIGLKKLTPEQRDKVKIELPTENPFGEINNMYVVLDRWLVLMENARDFNDQAKHLKYLNFNSNDVYYASEHQHYKLVAPQMAIQQEMEDAYNEFVQNKCADMRLTVTLDELRAYAQTTQSLLTKNSGINQASVYKYLGSQNYSAPFEHYLHAFAQIEWYPIATSLKNYLIVLIAATTTHERGYQCDIKKYLTKLHEYIVSRPDDTLYVMIDLMHLFEFANWLSWEEIVVVGILFYKITRDQKGFLNDLLVDDNKQEFIKHLVLHSRNTHALNAEIYLNCLMRLEDEKEDPQLQLKLPRLFSIIRSQDFETKDVETLLSVIKKFKEINGGYAYSQLIDILSVVQVKENSFPPTLKEFISCINTLNQIVGTSWSQLIADHLPANCFYDPKDRRLKPLPLIDTGSLLTTLMKNARSEGIVLEEKELKSPEALNYIAKKCAINPEYGLPLAKEAIKSLQKAALVRCQHEIKLEEKDIPALDEIIHTILYPRMNVTQIEETIAPMQFYTEEVKKLIEILKALQKKWPLNFSEIVQRICGTPQKSNAPRSIEYLNIFLNKILRNFSERSPFPLQLFSLFVEHEEKHGVEIKLLAVNDIFDTKNITRDHREQLLTLNFKFAIKKLNAVPFIQNIIKQYDKFSSIFSHLLKILNHQIDKGERLFQNTLQLLTLLSEINNDRFSEKIFSLLVNYPANFCEIIEKISAIKVEMKASGGNDSETKVAESKVKDSLEDKASSVSPKTFNKQTGVTQLIFQTCGVREFDNEKIQELIEFFSNQNETTLQQLLALRPPPRLITLKQMLIMNTCQPFLHNTCDPFYQYRDLKKQFEMTTVMGTIEEIKNLPTERPLHHSERKKLLESFLLINHYGHDPNYYIYVRETNKKELTAKDLTDDEIKKLVQDCKNVFKDPNSTAEKKHAARLLFNAVLREAVWRATGKFPYSTQMLAVLNAVENPGNSISGINTGEGKSLMLAMMAANLWLEGDAVNVCTANPELARVSFEEMAPFFDILGIPRSKKLTTAQTDVTEYCYDGINYSDTSQLALFLAKQKLNPFYIKNHANDKVSLALDEGDFTIFDDRAHYRFAMPLHKTDLSWVYKPLYKFIQTPAFKDKTATIKQDIDRARAILLSEAQNLRKNVDYVAAIPDEQINIWLDAAVAATQLCASNESKLREDFVIRQETRGVGDETYPVSFARILAKPRVCEKAEWGNSLHQFLHTRLNEEIKEKQWQIPPFPIDPETVPIASMGTKTVIDHHIKNGRVLAATGTPGSPEELEEAAERFGFRAFRIPPHKKSQRTSEEPVPANGEKDHFAKIIDNIFHHIQQRESFWYGAAREAQPQPFLVAFSDIKKSQRFYQALHQAIEEPRFKPYRHILRTQLLNGENYGNQTLVDNKEHPSEEEEVVSRGGVSGWITVATILDRGSDFKPRYFLEDTEQNHPLGLCVFLGDIVSVRLAEQIKGRAGRLGHPGQTRVIIDQKEFDELPIRPEQKRKLETMELLQAKRAASEKMQRLFAAKLEDIKNYFFKQFVALVQTGKYRFELATKYWANCLNKMDIEWLRLVNYYRHPSLNLNENDILKKCTEDFIGVICAEWNAFSPDEFVILRDPKIIAAPSVQVTKPEVKLDETVTPLHLGEVFLTNSYLQYCPLKLTLPANDQPFLDAKLKSKRSGFALEQIKQVFKREIEIKSLSSTELGFADAFKHLILKYYSGKKSLQECFQENLVEIFAIAEWGSQPQLQMNLKQGLIRALLNVATEKYTAFRDYLPRAIEYDKKENSGSKQEQDLAGMLSFLKKIVIEKINDEAQLPLAKQFLQKTLSFIQEDTVTMLKNVIAFIEIALVQLPLATRVAIKQAKNNNQFTQSWCALFSGESKEKEAKEKVPQDEMLETWEALDTDEVAIAKLQEPSMELLLPSMQMGPPGTKASSPKSAGPGPAVMLFPGPGETIFGKEPVPSTAIAKMTTPSPEVVEPIPPALAAAITPAPIAQETATVSAAFTDASKQRLSA